MSDYTDSQLIHIGFSDLKSARRWLGFSELDSMDIDVFLDVLGKNAANPDVALRSIVRLIEVCPEVASYCKDSPHKAAVLVRLLGVSEALGEFLIRHPEQLCVLDNVDVLGDCERIGAHEFQENLLRSVEAEPDVSMPTAGISGDSAYQALRIAYRRELIRITLRDVLSSGPVESVTRVGEELADLAAAAIHAAIAVSRAELTRVHDNVDLLQRVRFAVIGMGKCGARELNYISDVDVIYVHDLFPVDSQINSLSDEDSAAVIASKIASGVSRVMMAPSAEPPLWEIDANLRPEGKDGPLSRTVESHVRYYKKWAKSWEFQALLKARPIAGDRELGLRYADAITPFVWKSSQQAGFVESVQAMRGRVTDNIPLHERQRNIKLGPGGLRDVEFTVQLLQLVHGRKDERVRTQATTESLQALAEYGYIARKDAEQFELYYRWLRLLEHRIQLFRLRRTHLMPEKKEELSALAVAMQPAGTMQRASSDALVEQWKKIQRQVRGIHEKIFYRPLLAALSHTSLDGTALSDDQVRDRLQILGYKDPKAAQRHLQALTKGVSRRAEILRTLLPVLLEWIAQGVDPDAGLLGFRRVSEALGTSPWYLRMLRDSTTAAERLCQVLASSRYITDALEVQPQAVAWLGRDDDLAPRTLQQLDDEITAQIERHSNAHSAIRGIRVLRRREILRVALADVCGLLEVESVTCALSAIDQAAIAGTLRVAQRTVYEGHDGPIPEFLVIAMGRQGGQEIGYSSDADVMYAYQSYGEAAVYEQTALEQAQRIAQSIAQLLNAPCEPPIIAERILEIDNDLRPEGKQGAMVRSVSSYREYYDRWAQTWEFQALTRARPMAGDSAIAQEFMGLVDRYRYPQHFTEQQINDIRRMKARVENERLPQGADPYRHVKLGRGSLADVEWLVQTLQLRYGHVHVAMRTTNTLEALEAACREGFLDGSEAQILARSWKLCTQIRNYNLLRTGRSSDVLPKAGLDMEAVARWCGYSPGQSAAFEDDYLRITRQARTIFERLFYAAS